MVHHSSSDERIAGLYDKPDKINSTTDGLLDGFSRMKSELQFFFQKNIDSFFPNLKLAGIFANQDKIIDIAQIKFHPQIVFYELIEPIEIYIGEKLGSQIADRKPPIGRNPKKGFVFRNEFGQIRVAFAIIIFGRIVKNYFFGQP